MLLLLAFLLSKRGLTCALPIFSPSSLDAIVQDSDIDITTTSTVGACAGRSLWSILWSCLATTFACTWVSVHPNIPFLRNNKMSIRGWRIYLMLLSLIAPEIMILWAFKQCQGAVVIMKTVNNAVSDYSGVTKTDNMGRENVVGSGSAKVKEQKTDGSVKQDGDKKGEGEVATSKTDGPKEWTLTHAHYLQMGGFRLHCLDDEKVNAPMIPFRKVERYGGVKCDIWELPLSFETMKGFINKEVIDLPFVPKEEILDKCGRDALSKTIAMAQLTWFIIQIAARAHQNLAVTELELTTAALASLNIAMYISWWSKPTDILCPTIIMSKCLSEAMLSSRGRMNGIPDASAPQGECDQVESKITVMTTNSDGGDNVHPFKLGDKEIVNLATHYFAEFLKALGGSVEKLKSLAVSITTIFKAIPESWKVFRSKFIDYFQKRRTSSFGEKTRGTITMIWEAFVHLFLALIYFPILAILESGREIRFEPKSEAQTAVPETWTDDAVGLPDAEEKLNARTTIISNKGVTPEEVDGMSTIHLIFNKDALRLVLDMGFFCENVASSPFLCFSAFSGAIFGMIHCLAWSFVFPSDAEKLLWRLSSSIIAGLCCCIMAVAIVHIVKHARRTLPQGENSKGAPTKENTCMAKIRAKIRDRLEHMNLTEKACSAFAIFFVLTRLSLLTLSIIGLRDLPASAFDTVQWSEFIPHI